MNLQIKCSLLKSLTLLFISLFVVFCFTLVYISHYVIPDSNWCLDTPDEGIWDGGVGIWIEAPSISRTDTSSLQYGYRYESLPHENFNEQTLLKYRALIFIPQVIHSNGIRQDIMYSKDIASHLLHLVKLSKSTCDCESLNIRRRSVLFLPGHAGNYHQGRSLAIDHLLLASCRFRMCDKGLNNAPKDPVVCNSECVYEWLDYILFDFSSELSAFDADALIRQSKFVNNVVSSLSQLGQKYDLQGNSVDIIGHSMGGVVASSLSLDRLSWQPQTIITLGSPHHAPPIIDSSSIYSFYKTLREKSLSRFGKNSSQWNIETMYISICGAWRDVLVPPPLCSLQGIVPSSHLITVATTAIPNVLMSVDHQCLCWCRQLIRLILQYLLSSYRSSFSSRVSTAHDMFSTGISSNINDIYNLAFRSNQNFYFVNVSSITQRHEVSFGSATVFSLSPLVDMTKTLSIASSLTSQLPSSYSTPHLCHSMADYDCSCNNLIQIFGVSYDNTILECLPDDLYLLLSKKSKNITRCSFQNITSKFGYGVPLSQSSSVNGSNVTQLTRFIFTMTFDSAATLNIDDILVLAIVSNECSLTFPHTVDMTLSSVRNVFRDLDSVKLPVENSPSSVLEMEIEIEGFNQAPWVSYPMCDVVHTNDRTVVLSVYSDIVCSDMYPASVVIGTSFHKISAFGYTNAQMFAHLLLSPFHGTNRLGHEVKINNSNNVVVSFQAHVNPSLLVSFPRCHGNMTGEVLIKLNTQATISLFLVTHVSVIILTISSLSLIVFAMSIRFSIRFSPAVLLFTAACVMMMISSNSNMWVHEAIIIAVSAACLLTFMEIVALIGVIGRPLRVFLSKYFMLYIFFPCVLFIVLITFQVRFCVHVIQWILYSPMIFIVLIWMLWLLYFAPMDMNTCQPDFYLVICSLMYFIAEFPSLLLSWNHLVRSVSDEDGTMMLPAFDINKWLFSACACFPWNLIRLPSLLSSLNRPYVFVGCCIIIYLLVHSKSVLLYETRWNLVSCRCLLGLLERLHRTINKNKSI